jgi:hypothetical protein
LSTLILLVDETIPGMYFIESYNILWWISILLSILATTIAITTIVRNSGSIYIMLVVILLGVVDTASGIYHTGYISTFRVLNIIMFFSGYYLGHRKLLNPVPVILYASFTFAFLIYTFPYIFGQDLVVQRVLDGSLARTVPSFSGRWIGLVGSPNMLGYLSLCLVLYYTPKWKRTLSMNNFGFYTGLIGLILSFSRGAILAVLVTFTWQLKSNRNEIKSGSWFLLYGASLIVILIYGSSYILDTNLISQTSESTRLYNVEEAISVRSELFFEALLITVNNPIYGVGLENYQMVGRNLSSEGTDARHGAHLWLLEMGVTRGLLYMLLLMVMLYSLYGKSKQIKPRIESIRYGSIIIGTFVFSLTGGLSGLFIPWVLFGFILGNSDRTGGEK